MGFASSHNPYKSRVTSQLALRGQAREPPQGREPEPSLPEPELLEQVQALPQGLPF